MSSYLTPPHQNLEKPPKNLKAKNKRECSKIKKIDPAVLGPYHIPIERDGFYFILEIKNDLTILEADLL